MERRARRSNDPREALQYVVQALAERSEVEAIVLIDEQGCVVAATGTADGVERLAQITAPTVRGEGPELFEAITDNADFFGRAIDVGSGRVYLAALGKRVRKMHEAVYAVHRILAPAPAPT